MEGIHIRGGERKGSGRRVVGDIVLAFDNCAVGIRTEQLVGDHIIAHRTGSDVGNECDAQGIGSAYGKGLFREGYGNGRLTVRYTGLGGGADVGRNICRTGSVVSAGNSGLSFTVYPLYIDLITEVAKYGQVLAAVHHIYLIISWIVGAGVGIFVCALYDQDGGVADGNWTLIHIHGAACGNYTVGKIGKVRFSGKRLDDGGSRRKVSGVNCRQGVKGSITAVVHNELAV